MVSLNVSAPKPKMPKTIEKCVRKQNIMFMHEKTQFSAEYFQFMKRLLTCNQIYTHSSNTQDKLVSEYFSLVAFYSV
jgi:ubiquitin carboxyl-terminal hydrolase 9/24